MVSTADGGHSPSNSAIQQTVNTNQKISYSTATQSSQFPKKDQAIVIQAAEGIQLKDYIYAVGQHTDPTNIRFASKISNNRVCLFLSSKEIAEGMTRNQTHITINGTELEIRPLMTQYKRIILSNVYPTIPHSHIEDVLSKLGIRRNSAVTYLRVGIPEQGFSHILSFRRQVYIHPEDVNKLPQSIQIHHDETNYWIYPSADTLKCFLCKIDGHLAKNCPNAEITGDTFKQAEVLESQENTDKISKIKEKKAHVTSPKNIQPIAIKPADAGPPKSVETQENKTKNLSENKLGITKESLSLNSQVTPKKPDDVEPSPIVHTNQLSKRPRSETSSNSTQYEKTIDPINGPYEDKTDNIKAQKKKMKRTEPAEKQNLDDLLQPLRNMLDGPSSPLNYVQLKSFLENVHGAPNPLEVARKYIADVDQLINLIGELYPKLQDRGIKSRFTRLNKKLRKCKQTELLENTISQTSSDDEFSAQEN